MSVLKLFGYSEPREPDRGSEWLGPESNGRSPNGIPMPGVILKQVVPLAGQPPVGVHGGWGAAPQSWGSQGIGL